ncbi:MAG: ABC transporter permease [Eubacterium sp.]|nr:ABC transporter permease [Eubacterium sp.]
MLRKTSEHSFFFKQLVKRDFNQKYKRTVLGMAWSVISPLLTLLVMRLVFTQFFGRTMEHYTTYLFCGNLVMHYFREATTNGMSSLMGNAGIITKINVPKYLFLLSRNVSSLLNFALTLGVFFIFCAIDQITFSWKMILLVYPIFWLLVLNIGVGLILSGAFVFFRDIQYLYTVFLMLLQYLSAIFYNIDSFSPTTQKLFMFNPVYVIIRYFRLIVIDRVIPSPEHHSLCAAYAILTVLIGGLIYKRMNQKFVYHM